jgi:hypothetical protein
MNGILLNGQRVREARLASGDALEIGDVSLAFTVEAAADLLGEETVMMQTETPVQPLPEVAGGRR